MQNAGQLQNMTFVKDRMEDMRKQADELAGTIATMERTYALTQQLADTTHHTVGVTKEMVDITKEIRDNLADFDDFFRPVRNYFYWEPHCFDIPICWALRSVYEASMV